MVFKLPLSQLSVLFLASATLLLTVAALVWRYRGTSRVIDWFLVVLISDAAWALTSIIPLESGVVAIAFIGEVSRVTASSVAAMAWFIFSLIYTGRAYVLTRRRLAILVLPFILNVGAFSTAPFHTLAVSNLAVDIRPIATVVTYEFGPIFILATVYALLLVLTGTGLVAWTALTDPELYADQTIGLLVGAMVPIAGVALTVSGVYTVGNTNFTPATFGITAVGYGYALFRADLLEARPAIAVRGENVAIERLSEGFLVVDRRGTVVKTNTAAQNLLNHDNVVNQPVTTVLDTDAPLEDGQHLLELGDGAVLEAQVTSMSNSEHEEAGQVITLRDVTARQRRQERLEVLNRVLRHNVRNNLNTVRGYARQLADGNTEHIDIRTVARRIERNADSLISAAEKARTIERLLSVGQEAPRASVELSALLSEAVAEKRTEIEEPVDIRMSLSAEYEMQTNREVLRVVIDEVLANAVEHTDTDTTVWVELSAEDDVQIRIADDGPGIPEQEREAVLRGTETALEHSSHFGLWMVRWGVLYLDGELAIRDRSPTGTVVEITLPR